MLVALVVAIVLLCLGFVLLVHHGCKHMDDPEDSNAKREGSPYCCYFQRQDISNHETWILLCWTNAITIFILSAT